jgi:uncharacterized membrane protein HdeD (DUF308 family)
MGFGAGSTGAVEPPAGHGSVWFTIEGAALIALGVLAIVFSLAAGVAAALLIGWLLVISGVVGLVSTFRGGGHTHRTWSVVSALLAILVGLLVVFDPLAGALGVALLIGVFLVLDGVSQIGLALDQRKRGAARWGWFLAVGVFDILLAMLIFAMGPLGATSLLGFVVGVDLILAGIALIAVRRTALRAPSGI